MFDNMFAQLVDKKESAKISLLEYRQWQKRFSFEALKGKNYGQSFCEHFKIQDYRIYFTKDWNNIDSLIRREWVV